MVCPFRLVVGVFAVLLGMFLFVLQWWGWDSSSTKEEEDFATSTAAAAAAAAAATAAATTASVDVPATAVPLPTSRIPGIITSADFDAPSVRSGCPVTGPIRALRDSCVEFATCAPLLAPALAFVSAFLFPSRSNKDDVSGNDDNNNAGAGTGTGNSSSSNATMSASVGTTPAVPGIAIAADASAGVAACPVASVVSKCPVTRLYRTVTTPFTSLFTSSSTSSSISVTSQQSPSQRQRQSTSAIKPQRRVTAWADRSLTFRVVYSLSVCFVILLHVELIFGGPLSRHARALYLQHRDGGGLTLVPGTGGGLTSAVAQEVLSTAAAPTIIG